MAHRHWLWASIAVSLGVAACGDDDVTPAGDAGADGGEDNGKACSVKLSPGNSDQDKLQGALIDAESGDVICLRAGRYKLTGQLTLASEGVTLRGESGTVLDFSEQTSGANAIELSADHDTLDTLHIENPKGDGVRASEVDYPTIRNVHVEWTAGPSASNGGYGIYPVLSSHVLVEKCFTAGASDTGIYVGQSHDIIVRDNESTGNVAGFEIENSTDSELYRNHAHGNTGGILLFNLPGLSVKDGKRASVHDNKIEDNNLENFAGTGNIVHDVPAGTGLFILASDDNEVHHNTIKNHKSLGISVVSWYIVLRNDEARKDPEYDWFPERNSVHDNMLSSNGAEPQGTALLIASLVGETKLPDLSWDGIIDSEKLGSEPEAGEVPPESLRNCFKWNGEATFMNLDVGNDGKGKSSDAEPYACERPALEPLKF